jgi:LacI family transcriptional regulator
MAGNPQRPATIRDVAQSAGVSVGTVSRSLNAPDTVRPKTLERVRTAIEALGFKPDPRAQSMRRRNTMAIGIIIDDISNPVHAAIFAAAEAVLRDQGLFVRLVNTNGDARREAEAIDELQHGHVDGLIVTVDDESEPGCLERLRRLRIPCVLLDRAVELPLDSVATDHAAGMALTVDYLLELGHRRIGLITFDAAMHPGRDRIRGFRQAFLNRGLPCPEDLISARALGPDLGFGDASTLLRRRDRPTALVAGGNQILVGALRAIQQERLKVPEDLSLVTCDRTELAAVYPGPITVIDRDLAELGHTAARLLLERISDPAGRPPRRIMLGTSLILGRSCAAPGLAGRPQAAARQRRSRGPEARAGA